MAEAFCTMQYASWLPAWQNKVTEVVQQTNLGRGLSLSLSPAHRDAGLTHNAPVGNWCQLCGHDSTRATQNGVGAGHHGWGGVSGLGHRVHLVCRRAAARRREGCSLHSVEGDKLMPNGEEDQPLPR